MSDAVRPVVTIEPFCANSIHLTIETEHGDVVLYADYMGLIEIQQIPANCKVQVRS